MSNPLQHALSLHQAGKLAEAEAIYLQILAADPNHIEANALLGALYAQTGRLEIAVEKMKMPAALAPSPRHLSNLGNVLRRMGRYDEALAACDSAVALDPRYPEAYSNRGLVLLEIGRPAEAVESCRKAIELREAFPVAYNDLGSALLELRKVDEAIAAYRRALELAPNYVEPLNNLGNALKERGEFDAAVAAYRKAIALCPDLPHLKSNLIYSSYFHIGLDEAAIARDLADFQRVHAAPLAAMIRPHANVREKDRRLRIGYVSPDFRAHAESFFVVPLLENHDHANFEIHCYSTSPRADATTARIRSASDVWHDVFSKNDSQLAEQIRGDQIDILIDLTMHMAHNRALLFAQKPAPVQAAWLAYPGSTGLTAMDYRITDAHLEPLDLPNVYVESPIRLSDCWVCYDPLADIPPAARAGDAPLCFGCLNNPCKLNEATLATWAAVLCALPQATLLIRADSEAHRAAIHRIFSSQEIVPSRVGFTPRLSRIEYLRLHDGIDICFDTLPYNGITTTCDALWMGVPVITQVGTAAAGRAGKGLLTAMGLGDLVCSSPAEFIETAIMLAGDRQRRIALRTSLRQTIAQSPIMDARRFARKMESAFREMWARYCGKNA